MDTKMMVTRFAGIKGYDDDEMINVLIGFIEYQMKEEELREFLQQGIDADEEEEDELPAIGNRKRMEHGGVSMIIPVACGMMGIMGADLIPMIPLVALVKRGNKISYEIKNA